MRRVCDLILFLFRSAMEEIDDLELSFMKEANKDCGELQQEVDESMFHIYCKLLRVTTIVLL